MGFLSIMGKILIALAVLTLPLAVSLILVFSETLTTTEVAISPAAMSDHALCKRLDFWRTSYTDLLKKFGLVEPWT